MSNKGASDIAMVLRLLNVGRHYWPYIFSILLLDLLATPIALLTPLPLKLVVDSVLGGESPPEFLSAVIPDSWLSPSALLLFAVALLIGTAVLTQLQTLGATLLRAYTGGKLVLQFRTQMFRHAQRLSLSYHDMKGASDTLYRVQYDTAAVEQALINGIIPMIAAVVTVVSMLYVTAQINSRLLLVALVITPIIIMLTKLYRMPLRKRWKKHKSLDNAAMSVVSEVFSALRVVKAYSQENHEESRYEGRASKSLTEKLKAILLQGTFDIGASLATAIGTAVVLFVGVRTIQAGAMTVGDLLVVMTYLALLYTPLKKIGRRIASLQNALASADRAFSLIDQCPDVAEKPGATALLRARGDVEFRNVSFGHDRSECFLRNIDIRIPVGSRVGIVGKTGVGKTTLLSLLMRFYDPVSGQVMLDGIDVRDYKLADLRRQYAMVLQDTVLFSTTIRENIAYARLDASDQEIVAAAASARADDFISALPDGYQTLVGDRGMRLSGGERQRIALARAFLRDTPLLLLDEPTSALDSKTEAAILEVMEQLMTGRTTFIIAHRLSTVANVDMLLELKDGRLSVCNDIRDSAGTPGHSIRVRNA
jgi:ATP-binding cassette subfamily B protein